MFWLLTFQIVILCYSVSGPELPSKVAPKRIIGKSEVKARWDIEVRLCNNSDYLLRLKSSPAIPSGLRYTTVHFEIMYVNPIVVICCIGLG